MNETIERLKYYRYFCEKTIDIEAFDTAIKACQILEKLTEEIENMYGRETDLTREAREIINGK